jgi:aldose 1-epimerase
MSYSIKRTNQNGINLVVLENTDTGTYVSISPNYGALLHEFVLKTSDGLFNIVDNYQSLQELNDELALSYKSSKMSPFACRIKNAKYVYGGQQMEFPNKFFDGNAIHGLLFNKAFSVTDEFADDNEARVSLKYVYKKENEGYPFHYRCEVNYTLRAGNVLQLETTVTNLDDVTIPMADGWHPYFTLGDDVDNCLLYFNSNQMLESDKKSIPTGNVLQHNSYAQPTALGTTYLDNCFILNNNNGSPACKFLNPAKGLELSLYPDANYPYLQIYTPPHRKSIALENLSGAPDCFNNGRGLLLLAPGHSQTYSVYYKATQKSL